MKIQSASLSQAHWLGRGLLACAAVALANALPHPQRASQGAGWGRRANPFIQGGPPGQGRDSICLLIPQGALRSGTDPVDMH